MLKNRDIICISSIDWDFIWQGHQEIMSALAAAGNRVLFIENTGVRSPVWNDLPRIKRRIYNWLHSVKGIRKERENLYIYSPLIIPFPHSRVARSVNKRLLLGMLRKWIKSVGFLNPIIWTFLPTGIVLDIIDSIDSKAVIYYCVDNFEASSPKARKIRNTEKTLLSKADIVFVTSQCLFERCSAYSKNVHLFPYGINVGVYEKAEGSMAPADIAALKRPIVGYVGGVHKWIDFDLIRYLAESHKDKSFVFVGPLQRDVSKLSEFGNIHFLNQKPYKELPAYVSQFDVCVIPYLLTDYTKNVYPTKINEYLFMGKPIVSTGIPEVEAFNARNGQAVLLGRTKEEFSSMIDSALSESPSAQLRRARREIAVAEGSWDVKIDKMSRLIEDVILEKERESDVNWRDNILRLYKTSKRRLLPALAAGLLIYLAIFYTPVVWFFASPLKLSGEPVRSDAIVVLGGGVGESGMAGQGYEERVGYAAELYKRGYAGHLIFSSGRRYFFKETLMMKSLAVSLGVPEKAIILEEKAENTYRNVILSSRIMRENGWKRALVISSPYHMRRLSMVFRKAAGDIDAICAPIPKSAFYARNTKRLFGRKISPRQIRSILSEYMAIAYYWWRGWV